MNLFSFLLVLSYGLSITVVHNSVEFPSMRVFVVCQYYNHTQLTDSSTPIFYSVRLSVLIYFNGSHFSLLRVCFRNSKIYPKYIGD